MILRTSLSVIKLNDMLPSPDIEERKVNLERENKFEFHIQR